MSGLYAISDEQKVQFAGVVLLEGMINAPRRFPLLLEEDDACLEPVLEWLHSKSYVDIVDDAEYAPNKRGLEVFERFFARYSDFLRVFDVYCAVDLEQGEFAFGRFFDFEDEALWGAYLDEERWEDLRIAVAEFKKLDPIEIVVMNFLSEGRLNNSETGWQQRLVDQGLWDEMVEICNTALSIDDLAYEDDEGAVGGSEVMQDIIRQGAELNLALKKHENEVAADEEGDDAGTQGDGDETVEETTVEHYTPYLDPFYVSPVWMGLWLI